MKKHLIIALLIATATSYIWCGTTVTTQHGVKQTIDNVSGAATFSDDSQCCTYSIMDDGDEKITCSGKTNVSGTREGKSKNFKTAKNIYDQLKIKFVAP